VVLVTRVDVVLQKATVAAQLLVMRPVVAVVREVEEVQHLQTLKRR